MMHEQIWNKQKLFVNDLVEFSNCEYKTPDTKLMYTYKINTSSCTINHLSPVRVKTVSVN